MIDSINKKIKAVVFDFGGVIELNAAENILKSIARLLNVPHEEFRKTYFQYNHLANVDNMDWDDMVMKAVTVFNTDQAMERRVRAMSEHWRSQLKINSELLSWFPALRKLGFSVGIFSNNNTDLRERLNAQGIAKLVDVIVISAEIGFQKPHKEAFDVLFDKLDVRPEEVVFIDDTAKSLENAHEIGYIPVLFKNNEQLKVELAKLGIVLVS